ncbi:hypothetical protein [Natronorubrum sp. FCH18a]|uniref:hypothetical protein n=1 Tax=Natronorubrum sp. FCH18a TaxID=3447018 RepID=UPI003F513DE6
MALLRKLLRENGVGIGGWPIDRTMEARDESHRVRHKIPPIHLDTLYERDELYEVWLDYFNDVLEVG